MDSGWATAELFNLVKHIGARIPISNTHYNILLYSLYTIVYRVTSAVNGGQPL